jgi:flagellar hook-basal body complex protein FliE
MKRLEECMSISNVDSLLAEMRGVIATAQGGNSSSVASSGSADFSSALKRSLDGVANSQRLAENLQNGFVLGNDKVSLSDTMIAMQKANISFQAAVQVRNKLVSAYNDIMNMQV